jgi:hypothetical protein
VVLKHTNGTKGKRDMVQFVSMRDFTHRSLADLAKETLYGTLALKASDIALTLNSFALTIFYLHWHCIDLH